MSARNKSGLLADRNAQAAGLRYVEDRQLAIRRERNGRAFRYAALDGKPVHNDATLERIRSLAIPPAWTDVRICTNANGHLQAVGWDTRGRKQYLYHPQWRSARDENKYERLISFGQALPQ